MSSHRDRGIGGLLSRYDQISGLAVSDPPQEIASRILILLQNDAVTSVANQLHNPVTGNITFWDLIKNSHAGICCLRAGRGGIFANRPRSIGRQWLARFLHDDRRVKKTLLQHRPDRLERQRPLSPATQLSRFVARSPARLCMLEMQSPMKVSGNYPKTNAHPLRLSLQSLQKLEVQQFYSTTRLGRSYACWSRIS
jgi:hypothetical protein